MASSSGGEDSNDDLAGIAEEDRILKLARNGDLIRLKKLVEDDDANLSRVLNCKGNVPYVLYTLNPCLTY